MNKFFAASVTALLAALAGCDSETPAKAVQSASNAVFGPIFAQMIQKDDSRTAAKLNNRIMDTPACVPYKARITEAGKGNPYKGTTINAVMKGYEDAKKAGCAIDNQPSQ